MEKSRPYSQELERVEVDYDKVKEALASLKDMKILFVELGSETDFLSMGNRLDVLSDLINWISDTYGYQCLLASHHAGSTIPILEKSKIVFCGYVTPANRLGVMMFPTKKSSEVAIKNCKRPVIAIKSLAGGRIPPKPAFEYVYDELDIPCCMIGVGSENELERDASAAMEVYSR